MKIKWIIVTLILLVAVGGLVRWFWPGEEALTARTDQLPFTTGQGEDRLSELPRKPPVKIPRCLIPKSESCIQRLAMAPVGELKGEPLPSYLHAFIKPFAGKTVSEAPFYIMCREVKVAEFRAYVETLDDDTKRRLGNAWKEDNGVSYPDGNPVASVPWWAAKGYADWLAQETGCPFSLPTYNQWVSAAINYSKPETEVLRQETNKPMVQQREASPSTVVDLLGNLREWLLDSGSLKTCGSQYAVGEDYKTYRDQIAGEPLCLSQASTIGFRLVMPIAPEIGIANEVIQ